MARKFLPLVLLINLLSSCNKEPTSGDMPTNNDAPLLYAYAKLDTTLLPSHDTIYKQVYTYDTEKRNVGIDRIHYDHSGQPESMESAVYFFTGADTLPYKKEGRSFSLPGLIPQGTAFTEFFFYSNGLRITDSSTSNVNGFPEKAILNYTYLPNERILTYTNYSNGIPYSWQESYYVKFDNQNLTRQYYKSISGSSEDFTYTYDNKPNPFYRAQQKSRGTTIQYYEDFDYDMYQRNNPTIINQRDTLTLANVTQTSSWYLKLNYTYNANGYPAIVRVYDEDNEWYYNGIFIYK